MPAPVNAPFLPFFGLHNPDATFRIIRLDKSARIYASASRSMWQT